MKHLLWTRALALCALGAACLFAQQAPSAPRALSAARQRLESAAFAEEHERNFAQALLLYQEAEALALASKEIALAEEAKAARANLQARLEGLPAPRPLDQGQLEQRALEVLERISRSATASDESPELLGDLLLPNLRAALQGEPLEFGGHTFTLSPLRALETLVCIGTPAADALRLECARSPDPVVRQATAQTLKYQTSSSFTPEPVHIALALLSDPVASIRQRAWFSVQQSEDASLLPLAREGWLRGDPNALQWLLRQAPQRILEDFISNDLEPAARQLFFAQCSHWNWTPEAQQVAGFMASLLSDAPAGPLDDQRLQLLTNAVTSSRGRDPALPLAWEQQLLACRGRIPLEKLHQLLPDVGGVDSALWLLECSEAEPAVSTQALTQLQNTLYKLEQALAERDFAAGVELLRRLGQRPSTASNPTQNSFDPMRLLAESLSRQADQAKPEELLQYLLGLEGRAQRYFARAVFRDITDRLLAGSSWSKPSGERYSLQTLGPAWLPLWRLLLSPPLPGDTLQASQSSVRAALEAVGILKDHASLPLVIDLLRSGAVSDSGIQTLQALQADDARDAALIQSALRESLRPEQLERWPAAAELLLALEPALAVQTLGGLWGPALGAESKADLAYTLITGIEGLPADAWIVEHVDELRSLPRGEQRLEPLWLRRFSNNLCEAALPLIARALRSPLEQTRSGAQYAMAQFRLQREAIEEFERWQREQAGEEQAIDKLLELLGSPNAAVRLGAVEGLGALQARRALPALVQLLGGADTQLTQAIHQAIVNIGKSTPPAVEPPRPKPLPAQASSASEG